VHKDTVVACGRVQKEREVQHEVRQFSTVTKELLELGDWLEAEGITQVAMEATGVYWKPVWHMLEGRVQLVLANAAHIKNVPGRKSDVNDATWIADLLAHGLIRNSFVPPQPIMELRDLTRTRKQLSREIVSHTQRIQRVLQEANVKLDSVISNVVGVCHGGHECHPQRQQGILRCRFSASSPLSYQSDGRRRGARPRLPGPCCPWPQPPQRHQQRHRRACDRARLRECEGYEPLPA
jgi:hypothetical protein